MEYLFINEEQQSLVQGAHDIVEKVLKPRIHEFEQANDGLGAYPLDVHYTLAEAGYYAMGLPEEWGGLQLPYVTRGLILEEIAKVDAGFAFSFYNTGNFFPMIALTEISKDEKQKWADMHLCGDARGAFCFTEAEAGSDPKAMKTHAEKIGDEWVINGVKCFASHAPDANYFCVAAWTDKNEKPSKGISFFFVEKERGVEIGKRENKMGIKLSGTADVIFNDVKVPADHLIGGLGTGYTRALATIANERPLNAAMCLGIAESATDIAVEYAKNRRQFGKRIIDHQGLGFKIADMLSRNEASKSMVYYALNAIDQGIDSKYFTACTKKIVSDFAVQTTLDAIQVLGGYGYMKDYPVEKLLRDAKIFQIFGGTNEIQSKNIIAAVAGRDPLIKK